MSTAGRNATPAPAASDLAAALSAAGFVRLLARPDGDSVAATGVLVSALSATGTPFQASVVDPYAPTAGATQADYTVAVGDLDVAADAAVADDVAASATAFDVAGELASGDGADADSPDADEPGAEGPDPILALAGTIAADAVVPPVVEAAERVGVERRPGVSLPSADLADGLAHSTLLHASFSGDVDTARAALADLDAPETTADFAERDWRRLASLVALDATTDGTPTDAESMDATTAKIDVANERAAAAIERALRPHVGGPFETAGGYADVLDAAARERPGVALALALGHTGVREDAVAAWRDHGGAAHAALTDGETERHDGLFVVCAPSMPVGTVARLAADFRSPEPVTLAVADGEAAIHAVDGSDVAAALDDAVGSVDGTAVGTGDHARACFATGGADSEDWTEAGDAIVAAVREAL